MQTESVREVPPEAAFTLIAHLRQFPRDAERAPADLAQELGLDPGFVERVLQAVDPPDPEPTDEIRLRISLRPLYDGARSALGHFDRLTKRPLRFLLATIVFGALVALGLQLFTKSAGLSEFSRGFQLSVGWTTFVLVALVALHMALYFRHAKVRFTLYGAFALWSLLVPISVLGTLRSAAGNKDQWLAVGLTAFGVSILCLLYAGVGAICAVVGGWFQLRRIAWREERMSRQDLLARYFELQARFRRGTATGAPGEAWDDWPGVAAFRRLPRRWSALVGLLLGLVTVLITGPLALQTAASPNVARHLTEAMVNVLTFLAHLVIGFLCVRPRTALAASATVSVAAALPTLLPVGIFGPRYYGDPANVVDLLTGSAFLLGVAWVAALGAEVQARTNHQENLERNDQATLAAEMLRIQWRLSDGATTVCVLFVDVVRSRDMKATADPLTVEFSFREYQEWVRVTCEERGGRVTSTSGDGAVVAFRTPEEAFSAARRLQTDVEDFNRRWNRLSKPFRLRIGLHLGHVAGDLDEVQFTDVIDVTAHVQEAAPIAGIAVSAKVAKALANEDFVPLAREVDGHKVFLALNPMEDE
ncbi:MAG: adenylate/guanylate cyclase domain-containing protein [Fimbriimonas sp.]